MDRTGVPYTCNKLDEILNLVFQIQGIIEDVRADNERLREIANNKIYEVEVLESEIRDLNRHIDALDRQIADLS